MDIEGESTVESVMVDQGKAGTVNKTKIFVTVSHKDRFGQVFNRFTNTEHFDPGPAKALYKLDSRPVTDSGSNDGICLGEDKIGR